jgi:hypothetical protein
MSLILQMVLSTFETDSDRCDALQAMLDGLTAVNVIHLRRRSFPSLYASGVVYVGERLGRESWQDIPETLRLRNGDCEDLACYLAAEYRVAGFPARAFPSKKDVVVAGNRARLYHIRVRGPRGIEDPSAILGMKTS